MATPSLTDILDRIDELEGKVTETKAKKEESSSNGWIGQLIGWLVGLLAVASIAVGAYFLLRDLKKKNEELARLRTENEQDKVRQRNLEHEATVAVHAEHAARLRAEAHELEERVRDQTSRISATQAFFDRNTKRVLAARNWETLDALNKEGR